MPKCFSLDTERIPSEVVPDWTEVEAPHRAATEPNRPKVTRERPASFHLSPASSELAASKQRIAELESENAGLAEKLTETNEKYRIVSRAFLNLLSKSKPSESGLLLPNVRIVNEQGNLSLEAGVRTVHPELPN